MKTVEKIKKLSENEVFFKDFSEAFGNAEEGRLTLHTDENQALNKVELRIDMDTHSQMESVSILNTIDALRLLEEMVIDDDNVNVFTNIIYPSLPDDFNNETSYGEDFDDEILYDEGIMLGRCSCETEKRCYNVEISSSEYEQEIKIEGYADDDYKEYKLEERAKYSLAVTFLWTAGKIPVITFKVDRLTRNIDVNSKVKFNNYLKTLNETFNIDIPLEEIGTKPGTEEDFLKELKKYTSNNTVNKLFKKMNEPALNVETKIYLSYVDDADKEVEIKYYVRGNNFLWNCIDRDALKENTINCDLYLLDLDNIGYLEQEKYHINNIVYGKTNNYEAYLLDTFNDCINYDEQARYGRRHIVFCLNLGPVKNITKIGGYIYFLSEDGKVVCHFEEDEVKDEKRLVEKINKILKAVE